MAYASCSECNVTFRVSGTSLDGVTCQHCGGPVVWFGPAPVEEPHEGEGAGVPSTSSVASQSDPDETLMTSAFSDSATHSVDLADLDGETEKLIRPSLSSLTNPEPAKLVAPGAVPSQDRSTRQISNQASIDSDEAITGLFNKPVPEFPSSMHLVRRPRKDLRLRAESPIPTVGAQCLLNPRQLHQMDAR